MSRRVRPAELECAVCGYEQRHHVFDVGGIGHAFEPNTKGWDWKTGQPFERGACSSEDGLGSADASGGAQPPTLSVKAVPEPTSAERGGWELWFGNAMSIFPLPPTKEGAINFDVMITDPPYREHVHASATSASGKRGVRKRDMGFGHLTSDLRDYVAQCAAEVRRWSVIFSDMESIGEWKAALERAGATYVRSVPWVRWSQPQMSDDRPPSGCEMVILAWGCQKGRKSWNGPRNLTHFDRKCLRGESKHKAEKPLDLMLDLVSWFSDAGERVFDPLVGAGSTGVASVLLGRRFIGVEIDSKWYEFAGNRLRALPKLSKRDAERKRRWDEMGPFGVERIGEARTTT